MAVKHRLVPVILAGGVGTRLWPASTPEHPKQFLTFGGGASLLALSLLRVADEREFAPPVIVGSARHEDLIRRDCATAGVRPATLILEATAMNTAAAIALAALEARPADHLLVMPCDHLISGPALFRSTVMAQRNLLAEGVIVTFGIAPSRAETGYGYMQPGMPVSGSDARRIAAFHEKPDQETARKLIAGGWLWNSGIFLMEAATAIDQLQRLAPDILAACRESLARAERREDAVLPHGGPLAGLLPLSFDRAVLERGAPAVVVAFPGDWSDAGSWQEVWRVSPKDADGNACAGNVVLHDVRNAEVRSDGPLTVVCGLDDVVVVNAGGVVLVTAKARSQEVGRLITAALARPQP